MVENHGTGRIAQQRIVAIGASSGGLQPLERILSGLPADFPAAVFVVLHMGTSSHLAEILGRVSSLPVFSARTGEKIVPGHVYVAIPGLHMLIHDSHLLLRRGPRENYARPAIDPLFRSAACSFGSSVIGVVLSGALNDGTSGLRAIKRCGGIAVVQDPAEAAFPSMPTSAQRNLEVDHIATSSELAPLLAKLIRLPVGPSPPVPSDIRLETAIAAQELAGMTAEDALGKPSRFTCPECHGTLWEIEDGGLLRFRCHVGHAYTGEVVLASQAIEAEKMLWNLARAHQERAALARRMGEQENRAGRPNLAAQLLQRAREYEEDAEVVRRLLRGRPEAIEEASEQGTL